MGKVGEVVFVPSTILDILPLENHEQMGADVLKYFIPFLSTKVIVYQVKSYACYLYQFVVVLSFCYYLRYSNCHQSRLKINKTKDVVSERTRSHSILKTT